MSRERQSRKNGWVDYAKWIVVFLAYPIAGFAGRLIANPADSLIAAFITGGIAGAILGAAQWLALGRRQTKGTPRS